MEPLYVAIIAVGTLVAIINFVIGWVNRAQPLRATVRFIAAAVSLLVPVGLLLSKLALQLNLRPASHDPNLRSYIFIGAGLFVGATLMLPAYIERGGAEPTGPTIQERAARPAKATIRLERNTDSWVN